MRGIRVLVLAALLTWPGGRSGTLAAQSRAAALIAAGRAQLQAGQLDSAAVLLTLAADSATGGVVGERVEALVLLGVARHFSGDDSTTATAFHHALVLDPGFSASGLDALDSILGRILRAERAKLTQNVVAGPVGLSSTSPPAAPAPGDTLDQTLHECVHRCTAGEVKPRLLNTPSLPVAVPIEMGSQTRAYIVVELNVSAEGKVEYPSVRVVMSNLKAEEATVLEAVRGAQFTPARAGGHPVRAKVQLRWDFRAEGSRAVTWDVSGP
jgi:hypothetical protein